MSETMLYVARPNTVEVTQRTVPYLAESYYIVRGPGYTELLKASEFEVKYQPVPGHGPVHVPGQEALPL